MIPDRKTIARILELHGVPPHIVEHSIVVCRVALAIGKTLVQRGHIIDCELIEASALLHDLCKMECIQNGADHALRAEEVLSGYGYPRVAHVVGQHVRLRDKVLGEAMVVNYADKRVMHTEIVPLDVRFADLMERYGTNEHRRMIIQAHHSECVSMEHTIAGACLWSDSEIRELPSVSFHDALD